jgi:hypothetical protein
VNALADSRVADYLNENFICTYLKVGTFRIVNGQKQGGNVASYFCLHDGSVIHAIAGQVNAARLLSESRWAYEIRKSAHTLSTNLVTDVTDLKKFKAKVSLAHAERYYAEGHPWASNKSKALPMKMPMNRSQQSQVHWILGQDPLININDVYPRVWEHVLQEKLSDVPVENL